MKMEVNEIDSKRIEHEADIFAAKYRNGINMNFKQNSHRSYTAGAQSENLYQDEKTEKLVEFVNWILEEGYKKGSGIIYEKAETAINSYNNQK